VRTTESEHGRQPPARETRRDPQLCADGAAAGALEAGTSERLTRRCEPVCNAPYRHTPVAAALAYDLPSASRLHSFVRFRSAVADAPCRGRSTGRTGPAPRLLSPGPPSLSSYSERSSAPSRSASRAVRRDARTGTVLWRWSSLRSAHRYNTPVWDTCHRIRRSRRLPDAPFGLTSGGSLPDERSRATHRACSRAALAGHRQVVVGSRMYPLVGITTSSSSGMVPGFVSGMVASGAARTQAGSVLASGSWLAPRAASVMGACTARRTASWAVATIANSDSRPTVWASRPPRIAPRGWPPLPSSR
jgi:hypothetical protein